MNKDVLNNLFLITNYYPFGMLMPNRSENSSEYRYSFQGQEKDDEIKGQGNSINYKYRMHDPRIGRFFAVDPLTSRYPHWTPYQFSGNMVIQYVELEGLEPSKNPTDNSNDENAAIADVLTIGASSENNNNVDNYPNSSGQLCGTSSNDCIAGGLATASENGSNYISDTQQEPADQYNMFVGQQGVFIVDESNANQYINYESFVSNILLQNFITGEGPENYLFPTNGIISSKFLDSDILAQALNAFEQNGGQTTQYTFGFSSLAKNIFRNEDAFNIDGLVGSGTITVVPNKNTLSITIFNVTSLSSGAYTAKIPFVSPYDAPKSYVRNGAEITPFGNISQTFNLTIPYTP